MLCKNREELEIKDVEFEGDAFRHVYLSHQWIYKDTYRNGGDSLKSELEVGHDVSSEQLVGMVFNQRENEGLVNDWSKLVPL